MTVHRDRVCGCGHPESFHAPSGGPCMYGHDTLMGGCTCPGFGKKRKTPGATCGLDRALDDAIAALVALRAALAAQPLPLPAKVPARVLRESKRFLKEHAPKATPKLRAGERRMLEALARQHPTKLTRAQLGALVGIRARGSTFGTYLGVLKGNGYVEQDGDRLSLTAAGLKMGGGAGRPMTRAEILDLWRSKLRAGERKMLDAVVANGEVSRDDLGEIVDIDSCGSTFGTYLGVLKRNDLVVQTDERISLGPALAVAS